MEDLQANAKFWCVTFSITLLFEGLYCFELLLFSPKMSSENLRKHADDGFLLILFQRRI